MFEMFKKMMQYPRLTSNYPRQKFQADHMLGKPVIDSDQCAWCGECGKRCPSAAIQCDQTARRIGINLDRCIFCALCAEICPARAIRMTQEFELAELARQDLHPGWDAEMPETASDSLEVIGARAGERIRKVFGRSLQIREVDAGSCNGCDYEINALNNPMNDLERFGIHFVASPRHADLLLVTGIVSRNMELALRKTYEATPDPKLVVATGACACSGGIFRDSHVGRNGIDAILPVDAYIPGCPPRPQAIIYGILKALDRL